MEKVSFDLIQKFLKNHLSYNVSKSRKIHPKNDDSFSICYEFFVDSVTSVVDLVLLSKFCKTPYITICSNDILGVLILSIYYK